MESERTRIIAVDDDPGIVRFFRGLEDFGFTVCGIARTPDEAIELLRSKRPETVLVEIALERSEELPLVRSIRSEFPNVGVVVFSHLPEASHAESVLRAGALGFVSKSAPPGELPRALRAVSTRKAYFSAHTMTRMMTQMAQNPPARAFRNLTGRETQVFEMLCDDRSLDSIARELGLCLKTVEVYRRRIMDKLALSSVSDLDYFVRGWKQRDRSRQPKNLQGS